MIDRSDRAKEGGEQAISRREFIERVTVPLAASLAGATIGCALDGTNTGINEEYVRPAVTLATLRATPVLVGILSRAAVPENSRSVIQIEGIITTPSIVLFPGARGAAPSEGTIFGFASRTVLEVETRTEAALSKFTAAATDRSDTAVLRGRLFGESQPRLVNQVARNRWEIEGGFDESIELTWGASSRANVSGTYSVIDRGHDITGMFGPTNLDVSIQTPPGAFRMLTTFFG